MQSAPSNDRLLFPQFLLLLLLWSPAQAALAAAGKVLFVAGEVSLERAGAPAPGLPLAQGDSILAGDIVVTGLAARAQLLMADGARVALRASSRYQVDELSLPATVGAPGEARAVAADGRSVATLLKGGFRTQTGSIGKQDPAAYEVRTPVGVLGIRGTEYVAVLCQAGDCNDAPGVRPGELVRDGLYLGVFRNGIVIRQPGQPPRDLGPGEFVFIPLDEPGIETLPGALPFLLEDGHGELDLPGAPADATPPGQLEDFGARRAPAEDGAGAGPDLGDPLPSLPIGGTGPDGEAVDLTPGLPPPQAGTPLLNDVAFSLASLQGGGVLFGRSAGDEETILLDGTGLLAFPAFGQFGQSPGLATLLRATSSNVDTGSVVGLSWGRWSGGSATVTGDAFAAFSQDLAQQSLHWIVHEPATAVPLLPVAGTLSFQVVGSTTPTDAAGQAGQLLGASLAADFTNGTLASTLAVLINGQEWYAAGTAALGSGNQFDGIYASGSIGGTLPVAGAFSGFFSKVAADSEALAAGLAWKLADVLGNRPTITGVLAFAPSPGQPLPPPQARRDIAVAVGDFLDFPFLAGVLANQAADYEVDGNLDLTRLAAPIPLDSLPDTGSFRIGTAEVAESGVDGATLLRWGRWSGGVAQVSNSVGIEVDLDLTQGSLHWVSSPNAAAPPAIPQSGTASYALVGATMPTNNDGQTGLLGSASFVADFTNQQVESQIVLEMGQRQWQAIGLGQIGAQAGVADHQFSGFYDNVQITGPDPGSGFGEFSGFFSGPGASALLPDLPGGVGLSYSLSDSIIGDSIQGILIFQSPRD
jgi:hypothetical protein